jgi:hypothetical protein
MAPQHEDCRWEEDPPAHPSHGKDTPKHFCKEDTRQEEAAVQWCRGKEIHTWRLRTIRTIEIIYKKSKTLKPTTKTKAKTKINELQQLRRSLATFQQMYAPRSSRNCKKPQVLPSASNNQGGYHDGATPTHCRRDETPTTNESKTLARKTNSTPEKRTAKTLFR